MSEADSVSPSYDAIAEAWILWTLILFIVSGLIFMIRGATSTAAACPRRGGGAAGAFVTCDALSAHWGKNGSKASLIAFSLLSPVGYLLFGYLNRLQKLAVSGIVVNLAIAMGTVAVGLLLFHEQL